MITKAVKKLYGAVLALCVLALASCSDAVGTATTANQPEGDVTLSLGLSLGESGTRAMGSTEDGEDYPNTLYAYWKQGVDKVTVGITHNGKTTYRNLTVNNVSGDKKRAYVSMTVSSADAGTGDNITVYYPAFSDEAIASEDFNITLNYTSQDGSFDNLADYDPRSGSGTIVVTPSATDEDGNATQWVATLKNDIGLAIRATAYLGIKCTDESGNALNVQEVTVRPADTKDDPATKTCDPAWYTWRSKATIGNVTHDEAYKGEDYDEENHILYEYWGALIAHRKTAGTDRTYVAMPVANSGQAAVFTAITADGQVYATTKTWTGDAGNYYPVTMKMSQVAVPDPVDLGLSVKWAKWDLGMTSEHGYNASFYAWGEVSSRNGTMPRAKEYIPEFTWNYNWATAPYQCNNNGNVSIETTDNNPPSNPPSWRKYKGYEDSSLEPCDDAARVTWGPNWRMPSYGEISELLGDKGHKAVVYCNKYNDNQYGEPKDETDNVKMELVLTHSSGQAYYQFTSKVAGHEGATLVVTTQGIREDNLLKRSSHNVSTEIEDNRWATEMGAADETLDPIYAHYGTDLLLYKSPNMDWPSTWPASLSYNEYWYVLWYPIVQYRYVGCPIRPVYVDTTGGN